MSENTHSCHCGCGGHGAQADSQPGAPSQGAAAPVVPQPLGEGYSQASDGVVPGRKLGNVLGLRDISASAGGGCGCGGHGHGHGHGHAHGQGRGCGCGGHAKTDEQ